MLLPVNKHNSAASITLVLLISFLGFSCSKSGSASNIPADSTRIFSYAANIPVLRGLTANPIVNIVVSVPVGNANKTFTKIQCTLNPAALNDVQKVDVYLSDNVAFPSGTPSTSVSPVSSSFDIPVTLNVSQGAVKYIWLSVVLKNDASLNRQIELHAVKMTDDQNRDHIIDQGSSSYKKYSGVAVRKSGDDGVDTYRIPGLITTDVGTLIAVYDIRYNGSTDLPAAIDVGVSRSVDSGKTWSPMQVVLHMGAGSQQGVGDASILFDPATRKIWVAALWAANGHSIAQSLPGLTPDVTGQLVLANSADDGLSWSAPINITSQVKDSSWKIMFQGPGRGIAMDDGKLVFPAQYWDGSNMSYSTIIYSSDNGSTWHRGNNGAKSNTTESQVVETTQGTLMLNMRDNRGSYRSISTTTDLGNSWMTHPTSFNTLQDPVCMGSLIKANVNVAGVMKDVLFFSNPNTSAAPRKNITIKASLDLGQTWTAVNQLLVDERQCYGYSCLAKVNENTLGILYEGSKDLYFVKIPVSDIIK